MTVAPPALTRPESLDPRALDRAWARLVEAPEAPWLHAEVGRRMAERLAIMRQVPTQVLDWWGAAGASATLLAQAYPKARVQQVRRPLEPVQTEAVPLWRRLLGRQAPAPLEGAEVPPAAAQLLWSNMALHWAAEVPPLLADWHRALAVDGFVMFSTLGPGTLAWMPGEWAEAGWGVPYAPWVDMHDLGDMLVEAGFADPVMDQETLRLSFSSPEAALAELRSLGANTHRGRFAGLRTPAWRDAMHATLGKHRDAQGRVVLEFEVVYGHAFKPVPRAKVAAHTEVGLDDMKLMLAQRRSGEQRG